MKLSRLYSNLPELFAPIDFVSGLNVVLAEIRLPESQNKDTHNLGKTTLAYMLDFGFLLGRDADAFLFKYPDQFKDFIFFLEIQLASGSYVTVRRGVADHSKISFKRHSEARRDLTSVADFQWDHRDVPIDRARDILDGLLDWRGLSPWQYRKAMGYLLRSQDDYQDVFHLGKFKAGHADWKPFVAHLLGFDDDAIRKHYQKEDDLKKKQEKESSIKLELGTSVKDASKIDGLLLLKQQDAKKKQDLLDNFDFRAQDKNKTKQLVDEIDQRIADLNARRYSLSQNEKKIASALKEEQILFSPEAATQLFKEAGVLFEGQIKREFEQLIDFNRAITEERRAYLLEEQKEIETELKSVGSELNKFGKKRAESLAFLSGTDVFDKYKQVTDELVALRAEIISLETQRVHLRALQELREEIRKLTAERRALQAKIEKDLTVKSADEKSLFSTIRVFFSDIVEDVIDRKALLSVSLNNLGHLEFKADILDDSGNSTDAGFGHTYRKLLCIAIDLAVLRSHLSEQFPRFVYHDGIFESLDNRVKDNLLEVFRYYADLGLQPVITLIDSDSPSANEDGNPAFGDGEIVLLLHDEGEQGRLFKMAEW